MSQPPVNQILDVTLGFGQAIADEANKHADNKVPREVISSSMLSAVINILIDVQGERATARALAIIAESIVDNSKEEVIH